VTRIGLRVGVDKLVDRSRMLVDGSGMKLTGSQELWLREAGFGLFLA